jgi:hypothetical protein
MSSVAISINLEVSGGSCRVTGNDWAEGYFRMTTGYLPSDLGQSPEHLISFIIRRREGSFHISYRIVANVYNALHKL